METLNSPSKFLKDFKRTMKIAWGLADSTITGRMRCAKRLVNFLDGHPLKADKNNILDFLEKYPAQGMYKGVRVIYGRYFDTNLADDIKVPKFGFKPKKIPSKKHTSSLIVNR